MTSGKVHDRINLYDEGNERMGLTAANINDAIWFAFWLILPGWRVLVIIFLNGVFLRKPDG